MGAKIIESVEEESCLVEDGSDLVGGRLGPEELDPEELDPEELDPEELDPEELDPEELGPEELGPESGSDEFEEWMTGSSKRG